jgi:hypothetical protein
MAGVEFLLIACASAYSLGRTLDWSPRCSFLAALVFGLTPGLHLQATSCMNDGPATALIAATAALILARAHPGLIVLCVGLGAGIKPIYLYALPGLVLLEGLCRGSPRILLPSAKGSAALGAAGLGVGASWYLRNWVLFGNPIHPLGLGGMKTGGGAPLQRLGPSLQAFRENLLCLIDLRLSDSHEAADALCPGNANWGPAAFALGLPALLLLLRSEPLLRRLAMGLVLSLGSVLALVELDYFFTRFVLFFSLLPALALARLWDRHRYVAILGGAALACQILSTCLPANLPRESLGRMARESWRERSFDPPPVLPEGPGPVGYLSDDFGIVYPLYGPSFSRRVVFLREEQVDALMAALARDDVRVFYLGHLDDPKLRMIQEGVRLGRFRSISGNGWRGYQVIPGS